MRLPDAGRRCLIDLLTGGYRDIVPPDMHRYSSNSLVRTVLEQPILPCPITICRAVKLKRQVWKDGQRSGPWRRFDTPVVFAAGKDAIVKNGRPAIIPRRRNVRATYTKPRILFDRMRAGDRRGKGD